MKQEVLQQRYFEVEGNNFVDKGNDLGGKGSKRFDPIKILTDLAIVAGTLGIMHSHHADLSGWNLAVAAVLDGPIILTANDALIPVAQGLVKGRRAVGSFDFTFRQLGNFIRED